MNPQTSNQYFLGIRKEDRAAIFLRKPEWSCGWYWSFGNLGNSQESFWLDSLKTKSKTIRDESGFHVLDVYRNQSMYEILKEDFVVLNPRLTQDRSLWKFCELCETITRLRESAEIFGRGGSHVSANPCAATVKKTEWSKEINEKILPELFQAVDQIFHPDAADDDLLMDEIVKALLLFTQDPDAGIQKLEDLKNTI